mgnify:FL=1|tara:strand:+ start:119 stop:388 length:270 start_codon:yes stop_codon:yes gene_type:complete
MEVNSIPLYKNDLGVAKIKIGAKGFVCIGETPPMDHPHIYLTMPDDGSKFCLYCNTEFVYDDSLAIDSPYPEECYAGLLDDKNSLSTTI